MNAASASSITKAASRQSYYTIRFLADREHTDDAYRSYAYFRWVDDVLDSGMDSEPAPLAPAAGPRTEKEASGRRVFLERQKSLLETCYRGGSPEDANPHEQMLVELVRHDPQKNSGLQAYLRNMMSVMDFDARRRGSLISQAELNGYTRWLAVAVTEAIHYFIGHGAAAPFDETRYLAVSAAHITHMLRDTHEDVRAGYFNIPREVLEAGRFGPQDVDSPGYRAWAQSRVHLARGYFEAGRAYARQIRNPRLRLAGVAYTARFEWLLETIEKEGYILRPQYPERKSLGAGLRMSWLMLSSMMGLRGEAGVSQPVAPQRQGQV
jgi:phytoene/squalene synthetase